MAVTVLIPAALRAFTERQSEIEVEADTVLKAIEAVATKYPDIKKHLFKEEQELRDFINVFLGDENIKNKNGLETEIKDGDTVMLVPAIAGGKFLNLTTNLTNTTNLLFVVEAMVRVVCVVRGK